MGTTADLAAFATSLIYEDIPERVRRNAKIAITDSLCTVFAGLNEDSVSILRDAALAEAGDGKATVIGTGRSLYPGAAALINGAAAHALDFDSISLTVSGFVSSPTLFAILAVAENSGLKISGYQLIEAFVAGYEVEAAIARGLGVDHYSRGWHSTATLGHFGAAVGASKVLGLSQKQVQNAIGVVASEASGLRTMIGNMTNPFHVGKAARNGVTASLLASRGFTGEENVIEHPYGFAVAFNSVGNFDLEAMTAPLGKTWDLTDPGLVIKVYPCCGLIHSGIDAVLMLQEAEHFTKDDVESVAVAVHKLVPPTMKYHHPVTGYEAKFSTEFCIATALREGAVRLEHFTDELTRDPELQQLGTRIHMVVHEDLTDPSTFLVKEFTEITITLKDGRILTQRVKRPKNNGSRGDDDDLAIIKRKFDDCIKGHPGRERARKAVRMLENLEEVDDITQVMELLK